MAERHPMTEKGHRMLSEELSRLKTVERPRLAKAIGVARDHGDLSENFEYHAAKDEQGLCEARIRDIENKLATAQVVNINKLSGERVVFGATVQIEDVDTGDERTVAIVGEYEADADKGHISYKSPIARALIGKRLDDVVRVNLPSGAQDYEIRDITFVEIE